MSILVYCRKQYISDQSYFIDTLRPYSAYILTFYTNIILKYLVGFAVNCNTFRLTHQYNLIFVIVDPIYVAYT